MLPPEFVARFRAVAGFRNVLVHGYLDVDLARVHAVLNERLEEFAEFAPRGCVRLGSLTALRSWSDPRVR